MSQLTADQLNALANLTDALKGTTIEELIRANTGTKPAAESKSESALRDLEDVNPEMPGLMAILSKYTENHVTRTDNGSRSYYVPSAMKMLHVLNIMDTHLSDNYYARRALPTWFPTTSRLYFTILWIYQIARVLSDHSRLSITDESFVDDLLKKCPPEKLAIPGPLMPFFKAICASIPESKYMKPVVPALPNGFPAIPNRDDELQHASVSDRFWSTTSQIDWCIPCPRYIAHLHWLLQRPLPQKVTVGADDSHEEGESTVTLTDLTANDIGLNPANVIMRAQLLAAPRRTATRTYYPFDMNRIADHVPNGTTPAQATRRSIFAQDVDGPINALDNAEREPLSKLGLNEPILVHRDLVQQFVDNAYRSAVPEISTNDLDFVIESLDEFMMFDEGFTWFNKLAAEMANYARFFPESGTLADCSLLGPKFGQHITNVQRPDVLPRRPEYFADPNSLPTYDVKLTTSVSTADTVTESVARFSVNNTEIYADHPWLGRFANFSNRIGQFWDTYPNFTTGTIDHSWTQDDINIKNFIFTRAKELIK